MREPNRSGLAATELAVCLPLIVTLVFASIEICNTVFLKQSLHAAAYESMRFAVKSDATNAASVAQAERVLDARNVRSYTITFQPNDVSDAERGDWLTVTVAAPAGSNSLLSRFSYTGPTVSANLVMVKE